MKNCHGIVLNTRSSNKQICNTRMLLGDLCRGGCASILGKFLTPDTALYREDVTVQEEFKKKKVKLYLIR